MTLIEPGADGLDEVLAALQWRYTGRDEFVLAEGGVAHLAGEPVALLVLDGLIRVDGLTATRDLATGDFLFVPRAERFAIAAPAASTVLCVRLTSVGADSVLAALPSRIWLTDLPGQVPLVATMFGHLVQECPDPAGVQGDRVVTLIASMAIENWYARGCAPEQWLLRVDEPGVARAVAALHADPGKDWTVEALAKVALASRSGFAARFQAATGLTPGRYLTRLRVERAQRFLAQPDASVGTVARRLGYRSEAAFGRAFRRHTGRTPSEWRRAAGTSAGGAG
ncbi:AraC family transcriptional regulator [Nocardia neocaledoniensis]